MFLSLRSDVATALSEALAALDVSTPDFGIEDPPENVDAALASSVAFRLAAERGAPPPQVAEEIADALDTAGYDYLDRVSVAGPYVNFHPTEAYYDDTLAAAGEEGYGRLDPNGESVVVEHTSANPTGPVHVGRWGSRWCARPRLTPLSNRAGRTHPRRRSRACRRSRLRSGGS